MTRPRERTPEEQLKAKIREVRASRASAETKGAFTAVASLHRLEADLIRALTPPPLPAAQPLAELTDAELIAAVAAEIRAMPPVQRRAVLALVGAVDPPPLARVH
jgi:hypothetical protein